MLFLLPCLPAYAAVWAPYPIADVNAQQFNQRAVSDGSGGAIVAWRDNRNGIVELYVQHILSSGAVDPAWPVNGRLIGPYADGLMVASDGSGGAILGWAINADLDLHAQHVLASGEVDPAWPPGGLLFCAASGSQNQLQGVSDGAGGALLTWTDLRGGNADIYAQRVLASGVADPAWPVNGAAVLVATGSQTAPAAVSDGSGGMIVSWQSNNTEIRAQRVTASGNTAPGWPADGALICSASGNQTRSSICTDGESGAIVEWIDTRSGSFDIYAMRVLASGALAPGWTTDGVQLYAATGNQTSFSMISDGSGGAITAWTGGTDIRAQRISAAATIDWTVNGVVVSAAGNAKRLPCLTTDGGGGIFIAWQDRGVDNTNPRPDMFVHHFSGSGVADASWPVNGARITFDGATALGQPVMAAGSGTGFLVWDGSPHQVNVMGITTTWTQMFQLQVTVSPATSGTVTTNPLPRFLAYPAGSMVNLYAEGSFPFLEWTGDASGTTNPLDLVMDASKSVVANFAAYTVTVAASPSSAGTVTRSPNASLYPPGPVTLTAIPAQLYQLSEWSGDASGSTNPLILNVDGNKSVTAIFTPIPPSCGNWTLGDESAMGRPSVWDPVGARLLSLRSTTSQLPMQVWQFTLSGAWAQVTTAGNAPVGRGGNGLVYDSQRNRVLSIGGIQKAAPDNAVFELSLAGTPTWSAVLPSGNPPIRTDFTVIYDPVGDRVIRFGGSLTNEVWELSLSGTPTWTQIVPSGSPPAGRSWHVAIYDPVRQRLLVHGGLGSGGVVFADTWALSLSGPPIWSQMSAPSPPPPMFLSAATYDPIRDRMVLVSGAGAVGVDTDRTWFLSLEGQPFWSVLPPGPFSGGARNHHEAIYDPDDDVILAIGGDPGAGWVTDTRRLDCGGGMWLQTGAANGTVQVVPTKACYAHDEHVTLVASPANGNMFDQWLGDASGSANPLDVTMDDNKTIFAQIIERTTGVDDPPVMFALRVSPNPSAGPVAIEYALPREDHVRVRVFDISGREVSRLVDGTRPAGRHVATWGAASSGHGIPAGVYLLSYETTERSTARRIVIVR